MEQAQTRTPRIFWVDPGGVDKYGNVWPMNVIDKHPSEWVDRVTADRVKREYWDRFIRVVECDCEHEPVL